LSWLGLRAARAFGLCFCIFAFACVLCKSCSGIGFFFLFFCFCPYTFSSSFPSASSASCKHLSFFYLFLFLFLFLFFFFVLFAFLHSVPFYVHDGFLLHLCVCVHYGASALRCFLCPFSLSTSTLDWSAEGLQKLHFSGERDVLLFKDVEIYMMLLDISEVLNIL
jgi:hypothetical protein